MGGPAAYHSGCLWVPVVRRAAAGEVSPAVAEEAASAVSAAVASAAAVPAAAGNEYITTLLFL